MSDTDEARARVTLRDRFIAWVSRMLRLAFFRSVENVGELPPRGRLILAASHLNGFVDPVLMVARVGMLPRFLAKATLWDVVPARPALRFARIIPVQRRVDAGDATDNTSMFASAVGALRDRQVLALFPEGTTHDDATVRPMRTGAARIALEAAAAGLDDVCIVPIGIVYEDKVAVRGRVLVHIGDPISVPATNDDVTSPCEDLVEPDHVAVRQLTDQVQEAIRDLTPDFDSNEQAFALSTAASISLLHVGKGETAAPLADITERARQLSKAPADDVANLIDQTARYQMMLGALRISDGDLVADHRIRTLFRRVVLLGILLVVLAPFALVGLFANIIPVVIVLTVGLIPVAPVSKGTIRFLTAALVFPVTWAVIAIWSFDAGRAAAVVRDLTLPLEPVFSSLLGDRTGWVPSLVVFISLPLLGMLALVFAERFWRLLRDVVITRAMSDRRGQIPAARARRDSVETLVTTLLDPHE